MINQLMNHDFLFDTHPAESDVTGTTPFVVAKHIREGAHSELNLQYLKLICV